MKQKKILAVLPSLAALLLFAAAAYASVLPNGLSLEDFQVKVGQPALVGARVDIEYTLKNLGGDPIVLELPGPFVAARCDDKNVDFGHWQKVKELRPGASRQRRPQG